jgi:hypothetical protein
MTVPSVVRIRPRHGSTRRRDGPSHHRACIRRPESLSRQWSCRRSLLHERVVGSPNGPSGERRDECYSQQYDLAHGIPPMSVTPGSFCYSSAEESIQLRNPVVKENPPHERTMGGIGNGLRCGSGLYFKLTGHTGLFYLSLAIGSLSAFAAGPLKDRSTLSLTSTVTG